MEMETKKQFSQLLECLTDELDISESRYKEAEERYQAVGKWLGREDSPLAQYNPLLYPQGSAQLGTMVKPVSEEGQYDIDLVIQLKISKKNTTQQQLKMIVGDRLKANQTYFRMLDREGKRCWTLNYADGSKFHMDILPSIPDDYQWLLALGIPLEFARHAICITDKETMPMNLIWPQSNPKGYAEWFKQRMKTPFMEIRKFLAEKRGVEIENVPDYQVKTPLQRAIQVLKRHRDIMFENDPEGKPISIIITTLAGQAYNNEMDLYDALNSIIDGIPKQIQSNGGILLVPNPVNPKENFADKWQKNPQLAQNFKKWLGQVRKDVDDASGERGINKVSGVLKSAFGEGTTNEAFKRLGAKYRNQSASGGLKMMAGTGTLGTTGTTTVKKHTFYGQ